MRKIISGGQTGVDRAALDVALEFRMDCGGWCPSGRKAEDGTIAGRYPLQETPSAKYCQRTRRNVRDSDGTLILATGELTGGTAFTLAIATRIGRPCLVVDLDQPPNLASVVEWLESHRIGVLNVAGPRESQHPGIYDRAREFLRRLLGPR